MRPLVRSVLSQRHTAPSEGASWFWRTDRCTASPGRQAAAFADESLISDGKQIMGEVSRVRLLRASAPRREGRAPVIHHLFFSSLWKYQRSQKENTSQLLWAQPSRPCDTFGAAEARLLRLCLVLNSTRCFSPDFKKALKVAEFPRTNKSGMRRKHNGGLEVSRMLVGMSVSRPLRRRHRDQAEEGLSRPPSVLEFVARGARRDRKRLQLPPEDLKQ